MVYTFPDLSPSAGPCAIPIFIGNVTPGLQNSLRNFFQMNSSTTSCSGDFRFPHSAERKLLGVIGPGEIATGSWNPGISQLHF